MLPEYPKFRSFEFENLSSLTSSATICEGAPANLIIWKEFDKAKITTINGNPCGLISAPNEPPFFLEPFGSNKLEETIDLCLKHIGKISRATASLTKKLPADKYKITPLRSHFDYVYQRKTLAELKGRKFDGKRNHIKKFTEHFANYKYITLDPGSKKEALKLFEIWFEMKKHSRFFPKLAYLSQKGAVEKAFYYFNQLKFIGGAIFIDQEMSGFIMASPLNKKTLDVHFMYGHPGVRGVSQVLLWEACNKTFKNYELLNLEQDLGIPGLRKSKLSYYPLQLEEKFELTLK